MAKVLKQTFDEEVQNKKYVIRIDTDDEKAPLGNIYVRKSALEKAGVKINKIKSIEVQLTVHER